MRQTRLKAPLDLSAAYYHCISRVVNREFVFGEEEKEMFVRLMRRWEKFCRVRVITFCVMSNHFHVLVCPFSMLPETPSLVSGIVRPLAMSVTTNSAPRVATSPWPSGEKAFASNQSPEVDE